MQPQTMRSTPSVYSHVSTGRSASQRSRSQRSAVGLRPVPWYRKPLLREHKRVPIQKAAVITALCSMLVCAFTVATAIFDIYCLAMAMPGSSHTGYFMFSYEFVYVGNFHVRNSLIMFAMFSMLLSGFVFVASVMLFVALRQHAHHVGKHHGKEYEKRMVPWLVSAIVWWILRLLALIMFAIVNDLMFAYNIAVVVVWSLLLPIAAYGWLLVHTCYYEFANITRLEDLAHLRMGTLASLHASTTQSLSGSRPHTPHSTTHSTMPA